MTAEQISNLAAIVWAGLHSEDRWKEDAMQAASLAIIEAEKRASSFGKTPSRTYLLCAGRYAALRAVISQRNREGLPLEVADTAIGVADAEACDVAELLGRLNAGERELIDMRFYSAMRLREIAERLGKPISTIDSRIRRALDKMRGGR
jgi:RNA polymerase sigma factor (sigma-70 family)